MPTELYENVDEFSDSLELGIPYERLSFWTTNRGRSLADVTSWPNVRFPTAEIQQIVKAIRERTDALENKTTPGGDFLNDRKDEQLAKLMKELAHAELPKDHGWRGYLNTEIPQEFTPQNRDERDNFDYRTKEGLRVQVKVDFICFGFRWHNQPTENVCFEYTCKGQPSGFDNEHDCFCLCVPNIKGEPILQLYHDTQQLREYMKLWKVYSTYKIGNWKAVKSCRLYLPHYLTQLPPLEEPF